MQYKSKSKRRSRCRYHLSYLNIRNLTFGFLLLTLIIATNGQEEDKITNEIKNESGGNEATTDATSVDDNAYDPNAHEGHAHTIHEKLGQAHYPQVELTPYKSKAVYSVGRNYTTWPIHPAFNFTHFIFDKVITGKPALPSGYLVVKNESTLALGPKVEENDWRDLLAEYILVILWILLLLILIILVPFLGVCYCCFCCCRRCKLGCPPCDGPKDKRCSLIFSIVLLILLIILLLGLFTAFYASRTLDRGFDETSTTMKRGSKDTCTFLKDVSDHTYHVFVNNYEELEAHMTEILNEAANHIFLDLGDASESLALEQLERILDNMKEARKLMKEVEDLEKELRFNAAQLRDGVRGVKRDVAYTCTMMMVHDRCRYLLQTSSLQFVDSSNCLHLDKLPDTHIYVEAIEKIIKDGVADIPKKALLRFKEIGDKINVAMETVVPPLRMDIGKGHDIFQAQATKVRNLIDAVIIDIHSRTVHSTQSFEDMHDKYGTDRSVISMLACVLILLILVVLIAALIFGCFLNKSTGAHFLLVAIILIFCVFSFILLVSLFYYIIGLISYQGACAPLRDQGDNALFRELDSVLDLNKFLPASGAERDTKYSPMRMSNAIKGCMANQSIFQLLHEHNLYNTEDLLTIKVMPDGEDEEDKRGLVFEEDLEKVFLLTAEERIALNKMRNGNLSSYTSLMFTENMCKQLTPNLQNLANAIRNVSNYVYLPDNAWNEYTRIGRISLRNEATHLLLYEQKYSNVITTLMDRMTSKLLKIDELILFQNLKFSDSIQELTNAIVRAENFLRVRGNKFINSLGANLTDVLNDQIDNFIQGVIHNCDTNIGRCSPLSYIYYRGVDLICYRLVDPLNAFWLGLLICALTLIPIFFVAHRLMCLWKRLHAYRVIAVPVAPVGGCPTCTGAPYVPPPIITCTGGQQTFCVCSAGKLNRTDGGAAPSTSQIHVNDIADDDSLGQVTSIQSISELSRSQEAESALNMQLNPSKKSKSKED